MLTNCFSFYSSNGVVQVGGGTKEALEKIFESYRSRLFFVQRCLAFTNQDIALDAKTDEPDTISVDGTMRYFESLGVNLEDASMLVPMEIIQAPTVGEISKEGFVNGWKAVQYVSSNFSVF
jgi:DCN1-like protein 1/2